MEMSIDEAIKHLDTYSSTNGSGQTTQAQHEEAKRVAMDTMHKYQKIEQILKETPYGGDATVRRIQEVIEDGKRTDM